VRTSQGHVQSPKSIVLLGFMGVGKSTVGAELARRLGWDFVDMDMELVARFGPIAQQFAAHGEGVFRARETELARSLAGGGPKIVSTGGGVVTVSDTLDALRRVGTTVFLSAPWSVLTARGGGAARPLWDDAVRARYEQRLPAYRSADVEISAEGSVEQVVERILAWR